MGKRQQTRKSELSLRVWLPIITGQSKHNGIENVVTYLALEYPWHNNITINFPEKRLFENNRNLNEMITLMSTNDVLPLRAQN